jgi:hypothetical protein
MVQKRRLCHPTFYFFNLQFHTEGKVAANFARGFEHLLKREGAIVYRKKGSYIESSPFLNIPL